MHEQEFERSVRERMNELTFTPSAQVWQEVAQQIRARKRKRRLLVWLLVPAMVGGSFWVMQYAATTGRVAALPGKQQNERSPGATGTAPEKQVIPGRPATVFMAPTPTVQTPRVKDLSATHQTAAGLVAQYSKPAGKRQMQREGYPQKVEQAPPTSLQPRSSAPAAVYPGNADQADAAAATAPYRAEPLALQLAAAGPPRSGNLSALALGLSTKIQVPNVRNNRWQWSAQLMGGRAILVTPSLYGLTAPARDPAPASGAGNNFSGFRPPGQRAGSWLGASFTVHGQLAGRWQWYAGLGYQRLTQQFEIGKPIDRNLLPPNLNFDAGNRQQFYSAAGSGGQFTAGYHFLSLPVGVSVRPFRRLPVTTAVGLAAGRMLGGRELRYDTAARLFYTAPARLQRTQVQLQATVQYRLNMGKAWQLAAGPTFGYHVTPLYAGGNTGGHLLTAGAAIQLTHK